MPPSSARDAADLISGLDDDLLLHVLRFMPEAREVARTSALSRRWRDISTRAPVLHFRDGQAGGSTTKKTGKKNKKKKKKEEEEDGHMRYNEFIHNVLARRANSDAYIDTLDLYSTLWPGDSQADVWLRHAMQIVFHALTDLTLCTIKFIDGDDDRLGSLLSSSSCCPRLRRLTLRNLSGVKQLQLNGSALEFLGLDDLSVRRLVVDAPRLSALRLGFHFMEYDDEDEHTSLTVRAPALETLNSSMQLGYCQQLNLQGHTIQLLQECSPNVRHDLYIPGPEGQTEKEVEDEITAIPQFPGITNLTDGQSEKDYNTGSVSSGWKHGVVSLKYLREVEFSGFSGQGYCFDLVQLLLLSAPALERMILTMQAPKEGCRRPTIDLSSLESRLPHGTGKWTARLAFNVAALEWTPYSSMPEVGTGDA
ncbi:hypothetical protein CFC21_020397 [Triticum aestivum]|uniref:F-box domain-containing protein n=2 Tax=Triticum aestivum TaxID=4565 RepID=A0A9R1E7H0_WHEAT|nr:hypothetical protein CFC21_020397 [Triticum aestivum]